MNQEPPSLTTDEVDACVRLLESILENRLVLKDIPPEKRKALMMAAGRVSRPERLEMIQVAKKYRRAIKKNLRREDRAARAQTGIRVARQQTVFLPPVRTLDASSDNPNRLNHPRQCYVCKTRYTELHPFYDSMCTPCGNTNYEKRFQTARLDGSVALITGARLKIGYQAALKLLQAGARVIVTTRFPRDAAFRFAAEPDHADWAKRLNIYGLDLRHSPSVELFCNLIEQRYERLDYLINNAAQTVRRPPGFYSHLMERETQEFHSLPTAVQNLLQDHEDLKLKLSSHSQSQAPRSGNWLETVQAISAESGLGMGIRHSATLSLVPYHFEDMRADTELFPEGKLDADLQQVDLRKQNTWRLKLGEINTPEMLEVQLINSVAPFVLCGRLRRLMERDSTGEKHIINVSAMEGKFNRHTKTDKHPHTNMAKAALNMLTLTSAPDLAKRGIYMNAVDTGWVTDEDPIHHSESKQKEHDFHPPLDIVDGAARVLDPIFDLKLTGKVVWGKFLKDYAPTAW